MRINEIEFQLTYTLFKSFTHNHKLLTLVDYSKQQDRGNH